MNELSERDLESVTAGKEQSPCLTACAVKCAAECFATPSQARRAVRQASK